VVGVKEAFAAPDVLAAEAAAHPAGDAPTAAAAATLRRR
jgi:hypothetical protein